MGSKRSRWTEIRTSEGVVQGEVFSDGHAVLDLERPGGGHRIGPETVLADERTLAALLIWLGVPRDEAETRARETWGQLAAFFAYEPTPFRKRVSRFANRFANPS